MSLEPLKDAVVNCKTNTHAEKAKWLEIHQLAVGKTSHYSSITDNSLECWMTVDLKRKTKGRSVDMGKIDLPLFYNRLRAINPKKVNS